MDKAEDKPKISDFMPREQQFRSMSKWNRTVRAVCG